jgi:multiple sugar transport system ATP-binding protein
MAQLELRNVSKTFKTGKAVDGLSLAVDPGEIVAVFGPSGGGKTVLLRIISGIEEPEDGKVYIGGQDATTDAPEARCSRTCRRTTTS